MNKILRYSFVALLAMFGMNNAMAEDIIWSEDFSSYKADDVPSGGTYSYACDNGGGTTKIYEANLAGGTSPELLVAKGNGTFSATINLGSTSGDMFLAFKSNKNLTISVTGGTLGANTGTNNAYLYPITGASGTLTIEFKNELSQNSRLDDISLYQGTAKKDPGLTWGKASASVTFGNADESYKYIPTLKNDNNLSVTCTSSEPTVATVTNEGVVTVVGVGKTTITASFAGNDEYKAAETSFELTVNPAASTSESTIAEFIALADNTKGVLKLTDAQVLGIGNKYIVAKDATGVIMINDTRTEGAITATQGQKLSGTINGTKASLGGLNGIKTITESNVTASAGTITPVTVAVTEIQGKDYLTEVYKLENVDVKADGTRYYIMNGEEKVLQIYNEFKVDNQVEADGIYTLEGIRGKYNTTEQFWPTKITLVSSGISAIQADANFKNAPAYNMAGQRVNEGYKGLIIKGGKKIIVK